MGGIIEPYLTNNSKNKGFEMKGISTHYFGTTPEMGIAEVATKLHEKINEIVTRYGLEIITVLPHTGVVDGASCTIGYSILAQAPKQVQGSDDELPIVIAV